MDTVRTWREDVSAFYDVVMNVHCLGSGRRMSRVGPEEPEGKGVDNEGLKSLEGGGDDDEDDRGGRGDLSGDDWISGVSSLGTCVRSYRKSSRSRPGTVGTR
ncbi:Hypothetical predicted protein [Marmota monax]|uniref:Uncharacterized protein n=1 Tax=Marmota monax TaxID=9995 RepID=A0A5E4ANB4_MARMO|nr:Hypothetical predicted protein [Marmota monax]